MFEHTRQKLHVELVWMLAVPAPLRYLRPVDGNHHVVVRRFGKIASSLQPQLEPCRLGHRGETAHRKSVPLPGRCQQAVPQPALVFQERRLVDVVLLVVVAMQVRARQRPRRCSPLLLHPRPARHRVLELEDRLPSIGVRIGSRAHEVKRRARRKARRRRLEVIGHRLALTAQPQLRTVHSPAPITRPEELFIRHRVQPRRDRGQPRHHAAARCRPVPPPRETPVGTHHIVPVAFGERQRDQELFRHMELPP